MPYFGAVIYIRRDAKQFKIKLYESEAKTFLVSDFYRHIPRSCHMFNIWCLVYDTGQPYSTRKKPTEIQRTNLDKDEEELMSTSDTRTNSQKDISDENPS